MKIKEYINEVIDHATLKYDFSSAFDKKRMGDHIEATTNKVTDDIYNMTMQSPDMYFPYGFNLYTYLGEGEEKFLENIISKDNKNEIDLELIFDKGAKIEKAVKALLKVIDTPEEVKYVIKRINSHMIEKVNNATLDE